MPPRKGRASRAVANKRRAPVSSPPREFLTALPAAGNRKRSADNLADDDSDQDGDGEEYLARPAKTRRASSVNAFAATTTTTTTADEDTTPPLGDADSGPSNSGTSDSKDADPLPGGGPDRADKKANGGIDTSLPPISDVREMFEDMMVRLNPTALKESPIHLNVATLCSGTDAPIFALNLIQDALEAQGFGSGFEFEHLFSCEIEPFKQGFIRRNLPPGTLIFRDVVELASTARRGKATTASGSKAEIPAQQLDILFAGCSCVDYSNMNQSKPSGSVPALDRHLKQQPKKGQGRAAKKPATKKRATKKGAVSNADHDDEEDLSHIQRDEAFIGDLDEALSQLASLPSGGESARTFFAAVKLITVIQPKLIILENVSNAPWGLYIEQIFPKICYVAGYARLDSKDFYLPQTRRRGYLVAVDASKIGAKSASAIVKAWEDQIVNYRQPASAPVSAFLRPVDDPATIQARADMSKKSSPNSEWALCSLRHTDMRQKHSIHKDDNPFSMKAMRNNRLICTTFPSHSWLQFWKCQVARVVDLVDIAFATLRNDNVDLGYKISMIDVSQNVDRNPFIGAGRNRLKKGLGIVGCITPTGMPIVTDLMRPITGTEALALQGLPVDELTISTETQSQLRDLAGNAMTVTVVGAVALAVLLVVSKTNAATELLDRIQSARPERGLYLQAPRSESLEPSRNRTVTFDLESLLAIASRMARLCYCPAPADEVVVCLYCGTTVCSLCCGNPTHCFGTGMTMGCKPSAEQGKVQLRDILPNALTLGVPGSVISNALGSLGEDSYRSTVCDILNGEPVYFLDEIKVTEVVTVCYKTVHSIARLVLSSGSVCCWYIYIAPWHHRRVELSESFDLDQPIARGEVLFGDISIPHWSLWVPGCIELDLRLAETADGKLHPDKLSFAAEYDPAPDPSLHEWKNSVEAKVCGIYSHHPECGTAGNKLHIKQLSAASAGRVFMMWDSARLRDPDDDHFVWTNTMRRMEPHEYREILLHAKPTRSWELDYDAQRSMSVFWPGYWSSPLGDKRAEPVNFYNPVQLHWGPTETIRRTPCHTSGQTPVTHMPILAAMSAAFFGFPLSTHKFGRSRTDNSFYIVPAAVRDTFLTAIAFVSSELRRSRMPETLALVSHLDGRWISVAPCRACSVTPPEITVYTKKEEKKPKKAQGKTDGKKGGKKANEEADKPPRKKSTDDFKLTRLIIEDPDEAALFERQYQDLPRAVAVAARLRTGHSGFSTLDLRLMLQPKTLASRALAYLLQAHHTAAPGRMAVGSDAVTSFAVTLDYAPGSTAEFAPFAGSVQPCNEENTAGLDLTSEFRSPDADPPRFSRTFKKARKMTSVQYKLRPSQKEAVNWMLQRERAPLGFVKCEIEEEEVTPLNLRVVGKAEWTNRFPYSSRGGVVAHEIGYGKTVVTLAVCDYMREFDMTESISEREEKLDGAWSKELPSSFEHSAGNLPPLGLKADSFFCHLSATLVIVPRHITAQWESEVAKFLGLAKSKLLVIRSVPAFYGAFSLEQLQNAEIIIVSSAVFRKGFLDRLRPFSGKDTDFPAGLSGRTLEASYRGMLRNHRILTAYYLASRNANIPHEEVMKTISDKLLPGLMNKQKADFDALVEKQVPEIDRQFYKRAAKNAAEPVDATGFGVSEGEACPEEEQGDIGSGDKQGDTDQEDSQSDANTSKKPTEASNVGHEEKKPPWAISCLHNCSFARVVWDECSYDDADDHVSLFIANAVANSKWLVSGTPKLFSLEQVCGISAAFGVHVARPEPRMMPGLPALTTGPELKPMSKSEQFHVFSSQVRSVTLAQERHGHAETFVAAYFRANALDTEMPIESEEEVRPVDMAASDAVRYHLLNQEVLDAGYDYTALPEDSRHEVTLKAVDLVGRDGSAAAKLLLGLLACGVAENPSSITGLMEGLEGRRDTLGRQMKFLWDKMMWLRDWICSVLPSPRIGSKGGSASQLDTIQETLERVEVLCGNLTNALLEDGNFETFGGIGVFLREAALVAAQQSQPVVDGALKSQEPLHRRSDAMQSIQSHFCQGWEEGYSIDKTLYTWLDFFNVGAPTLNQLTEKQLRLLAKDLCRMRYTIDPKAASLRGSFPTMALTGTALDPGARRTIPSNIRELFENDKPVIDRLNKDQIMNLIKGCTEVKEETRKSEKPKSNSKIAGNIAAMSKASLVGHLTELNLKFSQSHGAEDLRERLRRYNNGLATYEHYRDGRAAPDRHRDFEAATSCTLDEVEKQAGAVNEELKRTMVHLTKTVDDFRATMLETNFIPQYSALANSPDKDGVVQNKPCCGCRKPLTSASTSFLVVACGHLLCSDCKSAAGFYCPVKDCPAFIRKRPVLRCSQVPTAPEGHPRAKASHVAELIKNEIPDGEYAVVFAQHRHLLSALAKAFTVAKLTFLDLSAMGDDDVAQRLEDFKAGKAGQILLLDMDSETSAGSNLTIATHIIFANPYLHHDEEHQVRTVRQAKGRCIRTGQTKKVRVYHLMVPGTVEEETLRRFGKESPSVQKFFDDLQRKPWWMDE